MSDLKNQNKNQNQTNNNNDKFEQEQEQEQEQNQNQNQTNNNNDEFEQKQIKFQKIKYKLKKVNNDDKIILSNNNYITIEVNCSYNFLLDKFGKSSNESFDGKTRIKWNVKVETSNQKTYYILIDGWKEPNTELKDITNWYIGGNIHEFLNYDKLVKYIQFDYKNYLKKNEKENIKKNQDNNMTNPNNLKKQNYQSESNTKIISSLINEEKYNLMNSQLSGYSDDDLASVLFMRFKNSGNFLIKEALIIHRTLEDSSNYNKKSSHTINNNNFDNKNNQYRHKISNKDTDNYDLNNKDYLNRKDKSKYNNKRKKSL